MTKRQKERRIAELKKEIEEEQKEINVMCNTIRAKRASIEVAKELIEKYEDEIIFGK